MDIFFGKEYEWTLCGPEKNEEAKPPRNAWTSRGMEGWVKEEFISLEIEDDLVRAAHMPVDGFCHQMRASIKRDTSFEPVLVYSA